jgi:hypothetical protein
VKNRRNPRTRGQACKARAKTLPEEDIILEEYILRENYKGNFPTWDAILKTANDLLSQLQIREQQPLEELTREGAVSWLKRHQSISTQRIPTIQKLLLNGYTRENCEHYFKSLEETLKEVDDETGFSIGDTSKLRGNRIVHSHSPRDRRYIVHSGRQEWLTVIECICSDGTAINPFIIIKSTRTQTSVETMADYTNAQTGSGWTKNDVGFKWLEGHFEPSTRKHALKDNGTSRKRLLSTSMAMAATTLSSLSTSAFLTTLFLSISPLIPPGNSNH